MNATLQSADSCVFAARRLHPDSMCSSSALNRIMLPPSVCMRMAHASPNASWTPTCTDSASGSTSTRRNGTRWRSSTPPVPYLYLTGGENLLDRGIRVLDAATGDPMAGDGAPEFTDPTRAAVHFEPPEHWMNDPERPVPLPGPVPHLYYQFNPYGWGWDNMHWGHAASRASSTPDSTVTP